MQMYTFKLKIDKEKLNLSLFKDGVVQMEKEWSEGRDMGQRLFEAIAELLTKNHLQPEEVSDFMVDSEIPEYCTSARIAETVKKAYIFGMMSSRPSLRVEESYL